MGILSAPDANELVLVEGALDVVNALLRPASPGQAARVHSAASGPVMGLILSQDDPGVLQSASEYLRCALGFHTWSHPHAHPSQQALS